MWKKWQLDGKEYLIKHTLNEGLHKLHITDLICLWCEEIREDSLIHRCKEMNKLLEASDEMLLNLIWSLVEEEGNDVVISFTDYNSGKQLSLQSNLDGLKFKIKFVLYQADHIQFFEEVSRPLLTAISELEKRQTLLVDLIKKKDLEINEYKLEGATISRKAVETELFDQECFTRKCAEDLGTTKGSVQARPSHTFTPTISRLLGDIATAPVIIPIENHQVPEGISLKNKNKGPLKLKSPKKAKKSKIYDDEEDEICDQEEIKNEDEDPVKEYVEQKPKIKANPSKGNTRPKAKKTFLNL